MTMGAGKYGWVIIEGKNHYRGTRESDVVDGTDGDDMLWGEQGDDILSGGAGNDWFQAGAGDDTMRGGTGDDLYFVRDPGDVVEELPGEGTDAVQAPFDYVLPANVESLSLYKDATIGTGNELNNIITGAHSNEQLFGLDGNDRLFGEGGADHLEGGAGIDYLFGGAGQDVLIGGAGSDLFGFYESDAATSRRKADAIADFNKTEGDRIYFWLDADPGTEGRQSFTFIGQSEFTGVPGQLGYDQVASEGMTYLRGDADGDGRADLWIGIAGFHDLTVSDFIL